ncbi:MAG: proline--tRNA ligase [Candidatus Acididesulfobacter diazotrophicus]|jgi:prolyl-tRNA synthetase|uniref:Proline--tRNA ligase n=1 Tax=Candidatus Acididesulfobacter diazotrophicus TaxID=2597226 RepID=A0A519BP45_9DELT|nr:MAG: proline--tRNA ligase [Candidatus Acididesulfobacter diazotrophicus]
MRYSQFFIPSLKEDPKEAVLQSHKLMLRAGYVRQLSGGIYAYLPLGYKSLKKLENIIREEMNNAGAIELSMPFVQPLELWKQSGRDKDYGKELLRFKDRQDRDFCLAPTYEEVITDLVGKNVHSYKELPLTLYQIHLKFRDEMRPRYGLMRAKEFIMKDAYSFDIDSGGLDESYRKMKKAYTNLFKRLGFDFIFIKADSGEIGGSYSEELMVISEYGEDKIAICNNCGYSASLESAVSAGNFPEPLKSCRQPKMTKLATPDKKTIEEVSGYLKIDAESFAKTIIYESEIGFIAAMVRGDREINEHKLKKIAEVKELNLAKEKDVENITCAPCGFAGPFGLQNIKLIIIDEEIQAQEYWITGANEKDFHMANVKPGRDFISDITADIRTVKDGDICLRCSGRLNVKNTIELGHIFKLEEKYSSVMDAGFLDEKGINKHFVMGCYGIGVGRTFQALIEIFSDENGINLPVSVSPFVVSVVSLNPNDENIKSIADKIYDDLLKSGIDVLYDDRKLSAGVKLKDNDLIGIPMKIIIGNKTIKENKFELSVRKTGEKEFYDNLEDLYARIKEFSLIDGFIK